MGLNFFYLFHLIQDACNVGLPKLTQCVEGGCAPKAANSYLQRLRQICLQDKVRACTLESCSMFHVKVKKSHTG